jgi:N-hydroxyarylamine O-acetyltransferase
MLTRAGDEFVLKAFVDDAWANQYGFNLSPQEFIDFMPANYLNSTHPDAIFVQKLLLVKHHADGRDILLGNRLKRVHCGTVEVQELSDDEVADVMRERFGL